MLHPDGFDSPSAVTFSDPDFVFLQTSLQEKIRFRTATGSSHTDPLLSGRQFESADHSHENTSDSLRYFCWYSILIELRKKLLVKSVNYLETGQYIREQAGAYSFQYALQ